MPVRFGIVGCGKVAERLALPQLNGCAQARVTALVDTKREAARRLAEQFGIDRRLVWTDWRRMLREAEVDAVAVCVPNFLHYEVTLGCCRAKKHVMVEKPIARTLQEADGMIDAARRAGVRLMVEQTQRFDPAHEVAKALLDSGRLGRIHTLRGRLGHAGPEYWSRTSPWYTRRAQSGGGALMDLGIHLVDLLLWLSGKSVKRLCASAATIEKRVPVEDTASLLMEFTDGTLGSCEVSWTTRVYEVMTWFQGERGKLTTANDRAHPVSVQWARTTGDPNKPRGAEVYPEVPRASRWGGAYAQFVDSVLHARPPGVSGEDGRRALEVVTAAYRSIQERCWVELPLAR